MKKILFTFVSLLSLLVLSTGSALAAPLADGYLVLREVRNDSAGSVIFVFDVAGKFSKSDFKGGFVTFGDNKFPLDCNLEGSVLQCTTSKATAGQYVTVNVGGFIFWTRVPEASGGGQYCYPVYDLDERDHWKQFDTHCQGTPANYGDTLIYFSEVFFELMNGSPFCSASQSGDGFFRQISC